MTMKEILDMNETLGTEQALQEEKPFDLTQHYPYGWLTLLEVPCDFYCFPSLMRFTGEREQGGMVFIPEKMCSIKDYQYHIPGNEEEMEDMLEGVKADILDPILGVGSCDIRPVFRGKTTFIFSDEYPIMNDIITNLAHQDIDMQSFSVEDFRTINYLNHNNLKNALYDNSLSRNELENIIREKSEELYLYIMSQVGERPFRLFYHAFFKDNLFKEITLEKYFRQFHQAFGIHLDSLVENWYHAEQLPLFDIRDARAVEVGKTDLPFVPDILYSFKIFNRSNVPGLVATGDNQAWMIPPHSGKEIRTHNRKDVSTFTSLSFLNMPLAQNLPSKIYLELENIENVHIDTVTGVFSLDSSVFCPNKNDNEIIVDNEDPGFQVVKAKGFNIIASFGKKRNNKKYYERLHREDSWLPAIHGDFYGFPVQSAYVKKAGSGKQKVEWSVQLPEEGKYEVFFYHAEPDDTEADARQEFFYTIFDGKEEHEVVAYVDADEVGWVSLGIFTFSQKAKVILCDKDRKNKVETEYGSFSQEIVADAMKWVKQ